MYIKNSIPNRFTHNKVLSLLVYFSNSIKHIMAIHSFKKSKTHIRHRFMTNKKKVPRLCDSPHYHELSQRASKETRTHHCVSNGNAIQTPFSPSLSPNSFAHQNHPPPTTINPPSKKNWGGGGDLNKPIRSPIWKPRFAQPSSSSCFPHASSSCSSSCLLLCCWCCFGNWDCCYRQKPPWMKDFLCFIFPFFLVYYDQREKERGIKQIEGKRDKKKIQKRRRQRCRERGRGRVGDTAQCPLYVTGVLSYLWSDRCTFGFYPFFQFLLNNPLIELKLEQDNYEKKMM